MNFLSKTDKQLIRDYVTAKDHLQYTQLPEGVVQVHITHSNLPQKLLDLRFDLHTSVTILFNIYTLYMNSVY